jgi:type I restriction enzyme S subunit
MNYIPRERYNLLGNGKVRKNDILFCLRGSLGKFASVGELSEGAIASSLVIVRPNQSVLNRFVQAYFQSALCSQMIEKFRNGAAQPNLSAGSLKKFQIPIPPLPEQQRIVSILDEAFEGISTAVENAEQNLINARELFDSQVSELFFKNMNGARETNLEGVISELVTGPFGSMLHKSDYVEDGVPVINPQNIIDGALLPLKSTMVSEETRRRLEKYCLRKGDIVIARRGEMGRCGIVEERQKGWLCGTGSMIIRLNNTVSIKYITLLLQSSKVRRRLEGDAVGTTMSNLNQGILLGVTFQLPSLDKQNSIVSELDALSEETQRLESIYQQKLAALDELKKSILHQAFSGQLN